MRVLEAARAAGRLCGRAPPSHVGVARGRRGGQRGLLLRVRLLDLAQVGGEVAARIAVTEQRVPLL